MDDYQKDSARLIKEKLTKRATHLNINNASEDPYAKNVKSLYEKAKKQESGALYSEEAANRFKSEETIKKKMLEEQTSPEEEKTNKESEFDDSFEDDFSESELEPNSESKTGYNPPSYDKILQKVKLKKSANKK
jgi:hypothetical protein